MRSRGSGEAWGWVVGLAGGVFEGGGDVAGFEGGVVGEDFGAVGAGGEEVEYVFDPDAQAAQAGATAAMVGGGGDAVELGHGAGLGALGFAVLVARPAVRAVALAWRARRSVAMRRASAIAALVAALGARISKGRACSAATLCRKTRTASETVRPMALRAAWAWSLVSSSILTWSMVVDMVALGVEGFGLCRTRSWLWLAWHLHCGEVMTYKSLKRRIAAVVGVLGFALLLSTAESVRRVWPDWQVFSAHPWLFGWMGDPLRATSGSATFISQNASLIGLIAGAYTAYCLQQRSKFVDALRLWWSEISNAKSEFYKFCDKNNPTEDEFLNSFYKISSAMDSLRLIFANVQRPKNGGVGYYPFEQVRDMVDLARSCGYRGTSDGGFMLAIESAEYRHKIKISMGEVFKSLRHSIQVEALSYTPDHPTPFDSAERNEYIGKIKSKFNIDVQKIREENKKIPSG